MHSITDIKKLNKQNDEELRVAREGTFTVLHNKDVLIRKSDPNTSKVLSGESAAAFIEDVRGKTPNYIKEKVLKYFK